MATWVEVMRQAAGLTRRELAAKAKLSYGTVRNCERRHPCAWFTQQKLLLAFGFSAVERSSLFAVDGRARESEALRSECDGGRTWVEARRQERWMSQSQLARTACLGVRTLVEVEHGGRCRRATQRKLLRAFGLTMADRSGLFTADGRARDQRESRTSEETAISA